jgi:hypothetical protein
MITLLAQTQQLPPERIQAVIDQIVLYQDRLNAVAVPTCAAEHARLVKALFTRVLNRLTAHKNGEQVDLRRVYSESLTSYAEIRRVDRELRALYRQLPES